MPTGRRCARTALPSISPWRRRPITTSSKASWSGAARSTRLAPSAAWRWPGATRPICASWVNPAPNWTATISPGSRAVRTTGGVHTPGTVMIQPAAYIKSLALGLWRDGVRVLECTPVLALEYVPGLAARTAGTIRAGRIILATNGHVRAFGHYRRQLMDITTFASITAPLSADQARALGGEAAWSLTPAAPHGSTVRRVRRPTAATDSFPQPVQGHGARSGLRQAAGPRAAGTPHRHPTPLSRPEGCDAVTLLGRGGYAYPPTPAPRWPRSRPGSSPPAARTDWVRCEAHSTACWRRASRWACPRTGWRRAVGASPPASRHQPLLRPALNACPGSAMRMPMNADTGAPWASWAWASSPPIWSGTAPRRRRPPHPASAQEPRHRPRTTRDWGCRSRPTRPGWHPAAGRSSWPAGRRDLPGAAADLPLTARHLVLSPWPPPASPTLPPC